MSLNTSIAKHREAIQEVIDSKNWIPLTDFIQQLQLKKNAIQQYSRIKKEWSDGYVIKKEKGKWAYGCIADYNEWKESRVKK